MRLEGTANFEGPIPHMVNDALDRVGHDLSGPVIIGQDGKNETRPAHKLVLPFWR